MKGYFLKKEVAAILLTAGIALFSAANVMLCLPALRAAFLGESQPPTADGYIAALEEAVNENILGRYALIESYGALHLLLGKKEENSFEVVKDNEGVLHNTFFANEVSGELGEVLAQVQRLHELSAASGAQFLVALPPDKFVTGVTDIDPGYPYNFSNETSDFFLSELTGRGIDNIDLRVPFEQSGWKLDQLFYRTDHHWTTAGAFLAYRYLVDWMESRYDLSLDPDGFYTDLNNYNVIRYPQQYLGSQGRKTGVLYSGLDDFELIYPTFKTQLRLEIAAYGIAQTGRVEDTLISSSAFGGKGIYDTDYYGMYLHGTLYGLGQVRNELRPDAPKLLLIRDSFACAPATYLASLFGRMDVIYPPYYTDSIRSLIQNGEYDLVLLMVYPSNLTRSFFSFSYR